MLKNGFSGTPKGFAESRSATGMASATNTRNPKLPNDASMAACAPVTPKSVRAVPCYT